MIAPVGHASKHPARWQCLQTSESMSHESSPARSRSTNSTCRQVELPSATVLSYDMPLKNIPSSGNWFHCLQATSQALQPMQTVVSVKKPLGTSHHRQIAAAFIAPFVPLERAAPHVTPRADIAGQRLRFLDRHVRIGDERDQKIRR